MDKQETFQFGVIVDKSEAYDPLTQQFISGEVSQNDIIRIVVNALRSADKRVYNINVHDFSKIEAFISGLSSDQEGLKPKTTIVYEPRLEEVV
ncbi:MAG: hypothetical protein IPP83_18915 [Flavobacteriales bacterium]|nr:hypothetical protein [Flavobacteriales bacterium]